MALRWELYSYFKSSLDLHVLRELTAGIKPNPDLAPISLGIGEPRHAAPSLRASSRSAERKRVLSLVLVWASLSRSALITVPMVA